MRLTGAGVNRNLLFAAGCLMVAISACGSTSSAPAPAQKSGTAQAAAGSDEVLATVEGQPITEGEVRKALGQNLSKLEEQAYELKKQQVEDLIADETAGGRGCAAGHDSRRARAAGGDGARRAGHRQRDCRIRGGQPQSHPGRPGPVHGPDPQLPRSSALRVACARRSSTRCGRKRRWRCTSRRRPSSAPRS